MNPNLHEPAEFGDNRSPSTSATLSGRRLVLARVGWLAILVLTMGLFFVSIPAYYDSLVNFADPGLKADTIQANLEAADISSDFYATYLLSTYTVSAMLWSAVSVVIFCRRSEDWMALFTSLGLLTFGVFFFSDGIYALSEQYPALWIPAHLLAFFGSVSFYLFFFLFPDGRFVPRWMYWVPLLWAAHEGAYYFFQNSVLNISRSFPLLDSLTNMIFLCAGVGAQLYRYRRVSGPVQRQQTKWVVLGMVLAGLGTVGFGLLIESSPKLSQFGSPYAFVVQTGILVFMLLIPLSIGIAILRYRLWDVDIVINRALVYGALTSSVVGIYALLVGTFGSLLQTRGSNFLLSLLAAGFVAVLFAPLRGGLQRAVNRLMYGERDDPYAVLSRLGRRLEATLEPDAVLPTIVETVAAALKLPYAAIAIRQKDDFEVAAAYGSPTGVEISLPLNYGGGAIGRLVLAPRAPGETFTTAERLLLEDLARQAEVAVQAVRLTDELQRSRERLVTAGEEERRRLRRDLHDGLGPTLASLSLGLDVSLKLLKKSPEDAEEMLSRLKGQTKEAVVDIRRLVYGLRPPALDDLGLVAAIREQAASHERLRKDGEGGTGLGFWVEAPEKLPPLPAAVEVACFRIAQEAITNVARHARATLCRVGLSVAPGENALNLEISDDGAGLPDATSRRSGVGLSSMRERAEELGGRLSVSPVPGGGTRVSARFPLPAPGVPEHTTESGEAASSVQVRVPDRMSEV